MGHSYIRSSAPWVERLWEICVRTLKNCMMETYMDCPYYEQLQFAMDTRLEALFTYSASADHALARKALIDFHYGMQPEGLTAGKYPSAYLQILSTFSLHYIYMLWEYYQQTGDRETIRFCFGDIDRILDYFDGKMGEDGLVGRLEFWEFVDWQQDWAEFSGIPRALQQGASTIINLMYAYALFCAAHLFTAMGRVGIAGEYQNRRRAVLEAVQRLCWDAEKGMYREGPQCRQFTQHAQAWAVLNGRLVEGEAARTVLAGAMPDVEAHVMSDGKLYLYGSYDDCKKEYCSNFCRVASTADMKNWKISGKGMKGTDVPWFDENASDRRFGLIYVDYRTQNSVLYNLGILRKML